MDTSTVERKQVAEHGPLRRFEDLPGPRRLPELDRAPDSGDRSTIVAAQTARDERVRHSLRYCHTRHCSCDSTFCGNDGP